MGERRLKMDIQLKQAGKFRYGPCPYCKSTASTFVVAADNSYRCMGCGRSGILGENNTTEEEKAVTGGHRLYRLNEEAAKVFEKQLYEPSGRNALKYLERRGVKPDTIKQFRLGYAGTKGMDQVFIRAGFSETELVDSGLFKKNEDGTLWFQLYGRVIYPITDAMGLVIGFGGRVLDDTEPKYKNSPETEVFSKRENLYAWEFASASSHEHIILCEGYMDVISMHQAGFDNAVASLGTALTEEQAQTIKSVADYVIILYDTDGPGRKATARAIEILRGAGIQAYVSDTLPAKDPDEFIVKYGAEKLQKKLRRAEDEKTYRLRLATDENGETDFETVCDILLENGADVESLVQKINKKRRSQ